MRDRWGRSVEPCGRAHLPGSHDRNIFQLPAPKTPPTAYLRDPVASLPWLTSGAPQSERGQCQSTAQRHDAQLGDGARRVKCLPNPRPRALNPARRPVPPPAPALRLSRTSSPHRNPVPCGQLPVLWDSGLLVGKPNSEASSVYPALDPLDQEGGN